ncbi:5-carboxymethyl-2-hydroxymuconate Delta-isomerase [Hirschia litorea]|uniref:5-carboxymethyl-2-hydroxymuconate Delta-isomerase n=1 Tax=Hirschia litorea TaxID=1199156 RepID=A0ABW2IL73_9PROT
MPNCLVEYSAPIAQHISPKQLVDTVQAAAIASDLFKPETVKTRALPFDCYTDHDGNPDFIHVTVAILPGRTPQQRQHLAQTMISNLKTLELSSTTLTVDIKDLDPAYTKTSI